MNRPNRTRLLGRTLLGLATATALALGVAGTAQAQAGKTVYFLTWGGTVQQTLEKDGWGKKFTEATGYTVQLVPKATGPEIIAAAIAQKDKPQVDVVQTDLLPFLVGNDQGIFSPLDATQIPNIAKLVDVARFDPNGVMTYGDVFSIIYNHDVFKKKGWAPPKAEWSELMRPEFRGMMVLPPINTTYGLYTLVTLARIHGGSERDIEPGFKALKTLAPGVVEWPTTFARMGQFLQDETAAVGLYSSSSAAEMQKRGLPVSYVVAKPLLFTGTAAGIMKNAPNPEGAKAFLNWWISKETLTYRAERYGNVTMNKDVTANPIPVSQLAEMQKIDYTHVNSQRSRWIQIFEREIAPLK